MTATLSHNNTYLPPLDLEKMSDVSLFLDQVETEAVLVGPDGQTIELPLEFYRILKQVAYAMKQGQAIVVAPVHQMLSTQEAANILGVSRPTLVKLLEQKEISYTQSPGGRHRKISLKDLLEYQERSYQKREKALAEMTQEAYEAGLYDVPREAYIEALKKARKESANRNVEI